jgi:REP element-mobilizing transposase RayT
MLANALNPTHGSEWMFQILSTTSNRTYSRIPPTEVGGWFRFFLQRTRHLTQNILFCVSMDLTPFKSLTWAYQLHYYLCFRTHRRRQCFLSKESFLKDLITEVCGRHEYHLLECQPHPDQLRSLISLRPSQCVAKTIQTIKTNSSREWNRRFDLQPPLWARGYLARSVGQIRMNAVREYLDQQSSHHGYDSRLLPPVYRYRAKDPVSLTASHASFDLNHHSCCLLINARASSTQLLEEC